MLAFTCLMNGGCSDELGQVSAVADDMQTRCSSITRSNDGMSTDLTGKAIGFYLDDSEGGKSSCTCHVDGAKQTVVLGGEYGVDERLVADSDEKTVVLHEPRVVLEGDDSRELTSEVQGICDALHKAIARAMFMRVVRVNAVCNALLDMQSSDSVRLSGGNGFMVSSDDGLSVCSFVDGEGDDWTLILNERGDLTAVASRSSIGLTFVQDNGAYAQFEDAETVGKINGAVDFVVK